MAKAQASVSGNEVASGVSRSKKAQSNMSVPIFLTLFAIALWGGCTQLDPKLAEKDRLHSTLGVPLDSEAGAAKLAALQYVSQQIQGPWPLLAPLSPSEIEKVRHLFSHDLISISTIGFRDDKFPATYDKRTGKTAVVIYAPHCEIHGDTALVSAGYTIRHAVLLRCHLSKAAGSWKVESAEETTVD